MNEHQKTLLGMLKDLDRVCKENDIKYMLFSGTALGAVRHHGFIPWDDDVDVILMRDQYYRLLDAAEKSLDPEKYYVQREYSEHWPMQFSKLRLNNTACIEKYRAKDPGMHQGVYIDIFPCDNLADRKLTRVMQFVSAKVVIAKSLYARGYETGSLLKKTFMQFCRILPAKPFAGFCIRKEDKNSAGVHTFLAGGSKYKRCLFDREVFEEAIEMPFEDGLFPVSSRFDEMLTTMYGDYMRIPDAADRRCKEHVAILDLHKSYTNYLDEQKTMKIETLTKSIR